MGKNAQASDVNARDLFSIITFAPPVLVADAALPETVVAAVVVVGGPYVLALESNAKHFVGKGKEVVKAFQVFLSSIRISGTTRSA